MTQDLVINAVPVARTLTRREVKGLPEAIRVMRSMINKTSYPESLTDVLERCADENGGCDGCEHYKYCWELYGYLC